MRALSFATIILALGLYPSDGAAYPEWQGHSGTWCLILPENRACLPEGFDVTRVGSRFVKFEMPRHDKEPVIFLEFEFSEADTVGKTELGKAFELAKSETVGKMQIGVYHAILNKDTKSRFVTVLGTVDHQFSMHAVGDTEERLLELMRNLANQLNSRPR